MLGLVKTHKQGDWKVIVLRQIPEIGKQNGITRFKMSMLAHLHRRLRGSASSSGQSHVLEHLGGSCLGVNMKSIRSMSKRAPYLMCRDDDLDILKNFVPDPLLAPMVDAICTTQQTGLNGWDLLRNGFCLLIR